jgi:hypothetical protein
VAVAVLGVVGCVAYHVFMRRGGLRVAKFCLLCFRLIDISSLIILHLTIASCSTPGTSSAITITSSSAPGLA